MPENWEVSLYKGTLTDERIRSEFARLKIAFPTVTREFLALLMDVLQEENFNDTRLHDAITNCIKTNKYPTVSIADIVSFDKKMKLFSYEQIQKAVNEGDKMSNFELYSPGKWYRKI